MLHTIKHRRSSAMVLLAASFLPPLLFGDPAAAQPRYSGRVGMSSDGNANDTDDFAAAAFGIAMLRAAGAQYVHHDYNNIVVFPSDGWPESNSEMEKEMRISVKEGARRFYGSDEMTFDIQDPKQRAVAIENVVRQINMSSADDPFIYILAGPMDIPYEGIAAADASKRKHVTIVSHSSWNDTMGGKTWNDIVTDFGKDGLTANHIEGQNRLLGRRGGIEKWSWMKGHENPDIRWVYSRLLPATTWKTGETNAPGDVSDSGMNYYVVSGMGKQDAKPTDIKNLLENPKP